MIDDALDRQSKYFLYRRQGSWTVRVSLQDPGVESGTDEAALPLPPVSTFYPFLNTLMDKQMRMSFMRAKFSIMAFNKLLCEECCGLWGACQRLIEPEG